MPKHKHIMTNTDKDVFIPLVPTVLGAMLMSKVSRQKEGFREDLIEMLEKDLINLPKENTLDLFKNSYVVANGFMEKWGVNYGHSSIKELDTLQMCIENKSRFFTEILETVQASKYMSYIEYSLRYNPPKSYHIPRELDAKKDFKQKYISYSDECFRVYNEIFEDFLELFKNKYKDMSEKDIKIKAFENARNVLPLSTHANMGMQSNLRAFCDGVSELFSYGDFCTEVSDTAELMKEEAEKVSVGMVKHIDASEYQKTLVKDFFSSFVGQRTNDSKDRVSIKELGGLQGTLDGYSFQGDFSKMNRFDSLPSEFRNIGKWIEVEMSEAGHHQFLRHRAFNYTPPLPNVDYGYLLPYELNSSDDTELTEKIKKKISDIYQKSVVLYKEFESSELAHIAPYLVLNCNIRRFKFFANFFALSHFITLRLEKHAQDEIRDLAFLLDEAFSKYEGDYKGFKFNKNK